MFHIHIGIKSIDNSITDSNVALCLLFYDERCLLLIDVYIFTYMQAEYLIVSKNFIKPFHFYGFPVKVSRGYEFSIFSGNIKG